MNTSQQQKNARSMLLGWLCMLAVSGPALAQNDNDDGENVADQDTIVIIGSRIKRTDMEGVSPVAQFSREQLEISGHNSLQDFIRTLTFTNGNTADDNNNSFANGTSTFNLRGLGNNATLVLVNGRRVAAYGQAQNITQNFVDLNSIPMAAVERVEVLKDGASALYGADAVAGVVNIVLRTDFDGAEYSIGYQTDTEGDSPQTSFNAIFGGGNDRTSFTTTLSYLGRDALFYRDRDFAVSADQRPRGGTDQRSTFGYPGTVFIPSLGAYSAAPGCPQDLIRPQLGGTVCSLNYNEFINFYPDSDRVSTALFVNHDINDDVTLYMDTSVNVNRSVNIAAPAPWVGPYGGIGVTTQSILPPGASNTQGIGFELYMPANNPFNPFGEDVGLVHRPVEFGPRTQEINGDTYRFNAGVKGYFSGTSWDYDVGLGYSRSNVLIENRNAINAVALQRLLMGIPDPAGSGDTLFYNPFGENDPRVLNTARMVYENRNVSWEKSLLANFTGSLFAMPAGDAGLAVGFEYRDVYFANESDPLRNVGGIVGTGQANDTFGARDITSVYAELALPLHDTVEAQIAARYEDYSDFGTTVKPKIGVRWQPLSELVLRASWGESFRAPSLAELFGGIVSSFPGGLVDPVRCPDPVGAQAGVNGNAADLNQNDCGNGQHQVNNGGNPLLEPEESTSWNFGVVWEPSMLENFAVSLDYFKFEHENIITTLPLTTILAINDPTQVIRANGPGTTIVLINNSFTNGAYQEISGFDMTMTYQMEWGEGLLGFQNSATYYDTFDFAPIALDANNNPIIGAPIDGTGNVTLGDFPQLRDNFSVSYTRGNHSVNATAHYRSGLRTTRANSLTGSADTPSWTTLDLSYTYLVGQNSKIQFGCINCADRDPVFDPNSSEEAGYFKSTDDPRGAVIFARWTQSF